MIAGVFHCTLYSYWAESPVFLVCLHRNTVQTLRSRVFSYQTQEYILHTEIQSTRLEIE